MRFTLYFLSALFLFQCSALDFVRGPASKKMVLDASGYLYDPKDKSCDGFPRLRVETMPGTCLGLVLPQSRAAGDSPKNNFVMPRTIVQVPGTKEFLVMDMGGWRPNHGTLYWMKPGSDGEYGLTELKTGLNMPHGLSFGPGGFVYVGESDQVSRFRFENGKVKGWQLVVGNLPRFKGHMHPLTEFTFDAKSGDLYINSGAPSDHCFTKGVNQYTYCPEGESRGMGAIYLVPGKFLKDIPPHGISFHVLAAAGLRNSMAMAVHSSGTLLQGENGRDFPQQEEPYEEINVIDPANLGYHYGWPYCYNAHAVSPEWKFSENSGSALHKDFVKPVDCSLKAPKEVGDYQAPLALMPPHAAPLHMAYYQGNALPLDGQLLVSWHGYQPSGHRLVSYRVDEKGRPRLEALTDAQTYSVNTKSGCPVQVPFRPEGGVDGYAPYTEVISGWNEIKGVRPKGAPVGFTEAEDGSIFIVEDRANRTVVRLARTSDNSTSRCEARVDAQPDPRIELLAWRHFLLTNPAAREGYENVKGKLVEKYCAGCHGGFKEDDIDQGAMSALDYLVKNEWLSPAKPDDSKIVQAVSQEGEMPPMPPGGSPQLLGSADEAETMKALRDWIKGLPTDMEKTYRRTTMKDGRKVRNLPTLDGSKVCGQLDAGQAVYVDPRTEEYTKASGWLWSKVYFVPGDSRLFQKQCDYPEDGVFYLAVRKLAP